MTKITYHLKSGKTIVNPDDGLAPAESARDVQRYLANGGNSTTVPNGSGGAVAIPASSVDYVELEA